MERREFFQASALGAAALLPRGAQASTELRLTPTAMAQFLSRLDRQQEWMARAPADGFFRAVGAVDLAERGRCEALMRKVLRSMHLTRSFRDLPEHGRAHPGMQQRVVDALPELDEAVSGARSFLVNLSPADRLDLQRTLREDPDVLPRLARYLEEESLRAGIAPDRSAQVRHQIEHLDRQLRRGTAGAVLDDYVARADRIAAEAGSIQEVAQRLRDRLGAPAFYTLQERQEALARSWWEQPPPTDYPGAGEVFRMGERPFSMEQDAARRRRFVAGAWLLGIGLTLSIPGLAAIPWTIGLSAIPATPGVPMLIAGIVLLAVYSRRSSS